jgi:hypothetical protein
MYLYVNNTLVAISCVAMQCPAKCLKSDSKSADRSGAELAKSIPEVSPNFEGTVHKSAEFFGDTSGDTLPL